MSDLSELPLYITLNDPLRTVRIGRTKLYELISSGEIVSNRNTGRRLIETKSLLRLMNSDEKASS